MCNSTSNDDQVHESQEDDKADPSGASQMQY
jgi:hypothetical protein